MKKISLAIVMLFLLVGCAGMETIPEDQRTFNKVFEAPELSQEQIYDGTKIWIAENFRSAKAVLEYENKESGTIIGNGNTKYPCTGMACIGVNDWKVHFTMRVDIKDNKYKTTFTNIELSWPPSYNSTFGATKGHRGPITSKGQLDLIKPILLKYGEKIQASLSKDIQASDW